MEIEKAKSYWLMAYLAALSYENVASALFFIDCLSSLKSVSYFQRLLAIKSKKKMHGYDSRKSN